MAESVLEEEFLALEAIYDDKFKVIENDGGPQKARVIIDAAEDAVENDARVSLYLEMTFPEQYPDVIPDFDLSNLHNAYFPADMRSTIADFIKEMARELTGEIMVYNVVEAVRERLPQWISDIAAARESKAAAAGGTVDDGDAVKQTDVKKEKDKMTKAQKRRYYDRFGATDEKPRGWDWVDIISHLSKT